MKIILLFLLPVSLIAQDSVLYRISNLPVKEKNKFKQFAFSGGLNHASFSQYDFNSDELLDLYVYDNQANKSQVYLHNIVSGVHKYTIDFEYEKTFPTDLGYWAMLRDYNCDNVMDLFSYEGTTVKMYKGSKVNGKLNFKLINGFVTAEDTGISTNRVQVYTCGVPIIEDVNHDGYLDIMSTQNFIGGATNITYMRNETGSKGKPCDSFILKVKSNCWGKMNMDLPLDFKLNQCGGVGADGMSTPYFKGNLRHCGSISAWLFDEDGDNDYEICAGEEFTSYAVYGRNGGHKDFGNIDSAVKNFPAYDTPIPYHLAQGYWMDVDGDSKKDLIATTLINSGQIDNYLERDHISFYKNIGTSKANFSLQQNDFLVGDAIDVGLGAYPVVFDYNGDGLQDLLISNDKYYVNDTDKYSGIFLFKNVGTTKAPSFEFVTHDFASLRKYKLNRIVPTLGDIDGDGDKDMIFGDKSTGLHISFNRGSASMANFDSVKLNYITLGSMNVNAAPYLFDINTDGKLDLLLGENNGMIYLMKNKGTVTNPIFDTIGMNRKLGKMSAQDSVLEYYYDLKPTIAIDGKYIYLGNRLGNIYKYEWNKDSIDKGTFNRLSLNCIPYNGGNYAGVGTGDINGDGKSEILIGNIRGGVHLYSTTIFDNALLADVDTVKVGAPTMGIHQTTDKKVTCYPNPANNELFLSGIEGGWVDYIIYNQLGQAVLQSRGINPAIDIQSLIPGFYYLKIQQDNTFYQTTFIKQHP